MNNKILKSNLLLLLTAAIWGFAFVAQRVGIKYVGAFTFNGIRFALGSISLIPLIMFFNKNKEQAKNIERSAVFPGIIAGIILFAASSLQQVGIIGTTAGKAGFITGLYIVLVPILGIFLKQYIGINSWIGAIVAVIGLYLLCVTGKFDISTSDMLILSSALFFAIHIILIDFLSLKVNSLNLAFFQFLTCSILSIISAIIFENINITNILHASVPILYGGIFSVGVAYTLQIFGQKHAEPSHAAIIMSMESVFATIGGFIILHEYLNLRSIIGCLLIFAGMIIAQVKINKKTIEESAEYDKVSVGK